MHFYYIDESGDTGSSLDDVKQPVMVIGGVSLRDEGWNKTQKEINARLVTFFGGTLPVNFELHADELLCKNGDGLFQGYNLDERKKLCMDMLNLLIERKHNVHYLAIDKQKMKNSTLSIKIIFDSKAPYLLGFDYLVTYIDWFVANKLGHSANGLIILDQKKQFHDDIERIMHERRFSGPESNRVKRIVEFAYAVDSKKNPMIQLSDLVIYCIRRFVEIENGYRNNLPSDVKQFYAECYAIIQQRLARQELVEREGKGLSHLNEYIKSVQIEPRRQWRRHYNLQPQQNLVTIG